MSAEPEVLRTMEAIVRNTNLLDLIDSTPAVRLHGPDWRGGKERTERMVHDLRLDPWVTVGDPVYGDAKWELMEHAGAFVYPSRWEAFGNSTVEAVAAGVPTLATPYPLGRFLAERGAALKIAIHAGHGLSIENVRPVVSWRWVMWPTAWWKRWCRVPAPDRFSGNNMHFQRSPMARAVLLACVAR